MMTLIHQALLAVGGSLALSIIVKITLSTALGLIGVRLARQSRAAVRHTLLVAVFGVLLLMPVASLVAPAIRIAVPAVMQEQVRPLYGAAAIPSPAPEHSGPATAIPVQVSSRPSLSAVLLTAWIAGAALFLLPVVMGLWQVRWLRRSALPWLETQTVLDELALDAAIHRPVDLLLHPALPGPMTCGIVRPAIVLPPDAQGWSGDDLKRAIVHELAHVRRGDWAVQCLARATCAVYWFHPLVWVAWRRLVLEAERSCDDVVLGNSDAGAYADQLVALAQRLSMATKSPHLAMASRADLTTRVRAVLDHRVPRGRAGRLSVALACAAAMVLVLSLSPLTLFAAPPSAVQEAGDQPAAQLAVSSMLVIETVTATGPDGKPVEGLEARDFVLTEDGVPQTIAVYEAQRVEGTPGNRDSLSSYYILGYYTSNLSADPQFRKVTIACPFNPIAKLNYRPGYYAKLGTPPPPSGPANGGIFDGTPPVLLYKKDPEYSEEARKAKYQGTALLRVEINDAGRVTNIHVSHSLGLGLDEKAMEAVKQWKFKPAMKAGKPVAMEAQVAVMFRLL
jgi:TonB family protein